jgi:hypothetical protein
MSPWNIFTKIKDVGKKIWNATKPVLQKVLPIAQTVAPMIANAFAPGSGGAVAAGLGVANGLVNGGDIGDAARSIFNGLSKPQAQQTQRTSTKSNPFSGMFTNERLQPQLRSDQQSRVSFEPPETWGETKPQSYDLDY